MDKQHCIAEADPSLAGAWEIVEEYEALDWTVAAMSLNGRGDKMLIVFVRDVERGNKENEG